jgi:hypothetical protein
MAFNKKVFAQALGQGLMKRGQGQASGPNFQDAFAEYLKKKKMKESSGVDYAPEMEKAKEVAPMLAPGLQVAQEKSLDEVDADNEEKKRKNFFKYLG